MPRLTSYRNLALMATMGLAACAAQPARIEAQAPTPAPVEASDNGMTGGEKQAVADNQIVVLFSEGSAALSPEANERLDTAARLFRDASPVVMYSTGYADPAGAEFPNLLLSANRAAAIKNALVRRGVPASQLFIRAFGESDPADPANPTAPENRRVTITWRMT